MIVSILSATSFPSDDFLDHARRLLHLRNLVHLDHFERARLEEIRAELDGPVDRTPLHAKRFVFQRNVLGDLALGHDVVNAHPAALHLFLADCQILLDDLEHVVVPGGVGECHLLRVALLRRPGPAWGPRRFELATAEVACLVRLPCRRDDLSGEVAGPLSNIDHVERAQNRCRPGHGSVSHIGGHDGSAITDTSEINVDVRLWYPTVHSRKLRDVVLIVVGQDVEIGLRVPLCNESGKGALGFFRPIKQPNNCLHGCTLLLRIAVTY